MSGQHLADIIVKARQDQKRAIQTHTKRIQKLIKKTSSMGMAVEGDEELVEDEAYIEMYDVMYGNQIVDCAKFARALFVYTAHGEGYISLIPGEVIVVQSKDANGWWFGQTPNNPPGGLFPGNHVEIITEEDMETAVMEMAKAISKKAISEMSEQELKMETEKLKLEIRKLEPKTKEIGEYLNNQRSTRKKLWQHCKTEFEEINSSYYGITPREDLLYDLRYTVALLDNLLEIEKEDVTLINHVIQKLEEFSTELTAQAQHAAIVKQTKREISQFVTDYKNGLEKKSQDFGYNFSTK